MQLVRVVMTIGILVAGRAAAFEMSRMVYWTDQNASRIQRARLDRTGVKDVLNSLHGLGSPRGLGIDAAGGKMYWVDGESGTIERANLDGSARQVLVEGLSFGADLALDTRSGLMYWADTGLQKIRRRRMDGFGPIGDIYAGPDDAPYYIEFDEVNKQLYWSDVDGSYIRRMSVASGSQPETVVSGLSQVRDIALDIDGGWVYWADRGTSRIQRKRLDGTGGVMDLFAPYEGLVRPHGLALDFDSRKIYWTDTRTYAIHRGNMDGTGAVEMFTAGLSGPWALAIVSTAVDADGDGDVDGGDYARLSGWWAIEGCGRHNGWCGGADLTVDGSVGFEDVAALASMWLAGR